MPEIADEMALGTRVWGRKVAELPARGILLVATDLQGNLSDFQAMRRVYEAEEAAGNEPVMAFCGDLVHGPGEDLNQPGAWPEHLGTEYIDRSVELMQEFDAWAQEARVFSLLGNHEHAHIGGPRVSKFHDDEAAFLDAAAGDFKDRMLALFEAFPLVAVAPNGVALTHAAPALPAGGPPADRAAFEALAYEGFSDRKMTEMIRLDQVGALLWARSAKAAEADALRAVLADGQGRQPTCFVFGHDVVWEGYDATGTTQLCLSTSYGLPDGNKVYLRVDLSRPVAGVQDFVEGTHVLRLHPHLDGAVPFPF